MRSKKIKIVFSLLMLCTSVAVLAYEEEDAVPLTFSAQSENASIEKIAVKLNGRDVEIRTELSNETSVIRLIGFSGNTPFFKQLGVAEDNADKTFSDLTFTFNAKVLKPKTYRRGFFLGEDVTDKLVKAGVSSLPSTESNSKQLRHRGLPLDDWQGYVAYSWVPEMPPHSKKNVAVIRYRALPQFGRDEISSDRFGRMVMSHCGKPDEVRKYVSGMNGGSGAVLFDRYEIPVKFLRMHDVTLDVSQPKKTWEGGRPLMSLVCGIESGTGDKVNFFGKVENPDNLISVLVISKFPELPNK